MPKYKVPVSYEMYGHIEIEASSKEEAAEKVYSSDVGLPENTSYVEASFQVDEIFFEEDEVLPEENGENTMTIKFPKVEVNLVGEDGNAFSILARVTKAMRQAGIDKESIDAYREEATSGDYNHLLQVTMKTVNCS